MIALGARSFRYGIVALVLITVVGTHHVDARQAPTPQRAHPIGCASLQRAQRHLADAEAALHTYMMAHKITPVERHAELTTDPTLAALYRRIQIDQAALTAVEGHLAQIDSTIQRARHDIARSSAALHAYMARYHIAPADLHAQASVDPTLATLYRQVQADRETMTTIHSRRTVACR